ncbi:hypothetical protein, partial [Escherichia coli]
MHCLAPGLFRAIAPG